MDNFNPKQDVHAVQLVITKSKGDTFKYTNLQHDVFDAYKGAIAEAKQYIYIENQYFRDQALTEALIDQLKAQNALQLIIVLPVAPEEEAQARKVHKEPDPFSLHIDFIQHDLIEKLRAVDNKRVGIYSVRRPRDGKDIYVHSKVMIVDDKWATIGSANTNPRGFFLDAEANMVIRDEGFAKKLRLDLWAEHLQMSVDIPSNRFIGIWSKQAEENDKRIQKKQHLNGRVHTHVPKKGKELDLKLIVDSLAMNKLDVITNALLRLLLPNINDYI